MIFDCISNDIPPQMKKFEYGYPHSNAISTVLSQIECCKPHNATHHLMKCEIINDVKLFPTVFFDVIQSEVALQKQMH